MNNVNISLNVMSEEGFEQLYTNVLVRKNKQFNCLLQTVSNICRKTRKMAGRSTGNSNNFFGKCAEMTKLVIRLPEPRHDKTNKISVRQAKTQISMASAQSDQSLRLRLMGSQCFFMLTAKTLIRLDAQADLSLRWVHTHFVGFVMSLSSSLNTYCYISFSVSRPFYLSHFPRFSVPLIPT